MRHIQRTQRALGLVFLSFSIYRGGCPHGNDLAAFLRVLSISISEILGIAIFVGVAAVFPAVAHLCPAVHLVWQSLLCPLRCFVCVYGEPPSGNLLFDQDLTRVSTNWLSIPLVMVLLVTLWQYRVLTHPAIRRLFDQGPRPSHTPQPNVG